MQLCKLTLLWCVGIIVIFMKIPTIQETPMIDEEVGSESGESELISSLDSVDEELKELQSKVKSILLDLRPSDKPSQ